MPEGDTVWRTAHRLAPGPGRSRPDRQRPALAIAGHRRPARGHHDRGPRPRQARAAAAATPASPCTATCAWTASGGWRPPTRSPPASCARTASGPSSAPATWTCIGTRLGMLDLVATADEGTLVGHLGPDLLGPGLGPVHGPGQPSARPAASHRRGAARPAAAGRHRDAVPRRVAVPPADPPVDAGRRPRRRGPRAPGRACSPAAPRQRRPRGPDHHRQPPTRARRPTSMPAPADRAGAAAPASASR